MDVMLTAEGLLGTDVAVQVLHLQFEQDRVAGVKCLGAHRAQHHLETAGRLSFQEGHLITSSASECIACYHLRHLECITRKMVKCWARSRAFNVKGITLLYVLPPCRRSRTMTTQPGSEAAAPAAAAGEAAAPAAAGQVGGAFGTFAGAAQAAPSAEAQPAAAPTAADPAMEAEIIARLRRRTDSHGCTGASLRLL